jgi:mono/diheme cytochrome c family protein
MKKAKPVEIAQVYELNCARCHGTDGAAMKFGSKNLQVSALSAEEAASIIKNGKGAMPAISGNYTDAEIKQLSEYVITLRKK